MDETWFKIIKFHKAEGFPSLLTESGAVISASDISPWCTAASQWMGSKGAPAIIQLADKLVNLSEDGNEILPLFPNNPAWNDLDESTDGQRQLLILIGNSAFGKSLGIPATARINQLSEAKVQEQYLGFRRISLQLSYLLAVSSTSPFQHPRHLHRTRCIVNEGGFATPPRWFHPTQTNHREASSGSPRHSHSDEDAADK